jgi:hypothetical protein
MKPGKKEYLLIGWSILLILVNVLWLVLDKNPPAWDQAAHLRGVVNTNLFLRGRFEGGFLGLLRSLWGYPPLIYFVGAFWSFISGIGVNQITFLNTIFLILAMWGVYKLAGNKVLPAILFSLFPVIYDISRNMLLDLALTVWVIWGLYFWLRKNDEKWLLMLILASLTKLNGFLYFLPMVLISTIERFKEKGFWKKAIIGVFIYGIAVGWWWLLNWSAIYQYLTGLAGQGEELTDPMNLLSLTTWIHYLRLFFLQQIGPIVGVVFGISLLKVDFENEENKKLLWWLLMTYVVFTIIKNKDFRFTMPLLSVVAIYFGQGLLKIKKKWLIALVFGWMLFNYIENSFNWPVRKPMVVSTPTFLMGDVNWIDFSDYPVREVRQNKWPNVEIINDLPNWKNSVLVVMNSAEINDNNLQLYRLILGKNEIEIHGIDRWGTMNFDYVLVPDLETESAPFYDVQLAKRKEIINEIWQKNSHDFIIVAEYVLPNKQGKVYLFKGSS